jgi:hypothetical protein
VLTARRILVATHARDELPEILGSASGGVGISCTARTVTGGRSATSPSGCWVRSPPQSSVQLVRQWSDDVAFFVHTYDLTAAEAVELEAREIRIVRGEIARLVVEDDRLIGVELSDGRVIARTAVFIRPRNVPHADGLLTGLGCELDEGGFVTVDGTGLTSAVGVWAAGNVVDPPAQVITAAGAGSTAAIAINADLVQEDVERAAEEHHALATHPLPR